MVRSAHYRGSFFIIGLPVFQNRGKCLEIVFFKFIRLGLGKIFKLKKGMEEGGLFPL